GLQTEPSLLDNVTYRVTASRLNLRSQPKVEASNRIGSLPQGTEVLKVAAAQVPEWAKVRVILNGEPLEGFVASKHLQPLM
ncbi:MAG: SH3 domain-containing protein, partial [Terriglobia bacterium]